MGDDMHDVFDSAGNLVGSVPISENQMEILQAGNPIQIQYHTPRALAGNESGSFQLQMTNGVIITTTPDQVKRFLAIQARLND
jgi:hypothetical protein